MALTTLDPNTALIIIDLQKGIVGLPGIPAIADVIRCARTLADAFRARRLPVALVNVVGGAPGRTEQTRQAAARPEGWTDFIPELDRQAGDIVVTKRTWGAFATTDLEVRLEALGVTSRDRGREAPASRRRRVKPMSRTQRHPRHRMR